MRPVCGLLVQLCEEQCLPLFEQKFYLLIFSLFSRGIFLVFFLFYLVWAWATVDIEIARPAQGWERKSVLTPRQGWRWHAFQDRSMDQARCPVGGGQQRPTRDRYAAGGLCTGSDRHLHWRREKARCAHRQGDAEGASSYFAVQNFASARYGGWTTANEGALGGLYLTSVACVCACVRVHPIVFPEEGASLPLSRKAPSVAAATAVRACGRLGSEDRSLFPIPVVS